MKTIVIPFESDDVDVDDQGRRYVSLRSTSSEANGSWTKAVKRITFPLDLPKGAKIQTAILTFTNGSPTVANGLFTADGVSVSYHDEKQLEIAIEDGAESRVVEFCYKPTGTSYTTSAVRIYDATLTVTYSNPYSMLYLAEVGSMVPYAIFHGENGELVPYSMFHCEDGELVRY